VESAPAPSNPFSAALEDAAAAALGPAELAELAEFGVERAIEPGDVLFRAGDHTYDFFVVLDGEAEILRSDVEHDEVIAAHGPGGFLGELNLLTGQRAFLTARASRPGRVLVISPAEFRRLMSSKPAIADTIVRALLARREMLRTGTGARAVRIIGSRYSREAMALRAFASRARIVHKWIDLESADDVDVLLASMGLRSVDTPVVITPTAVLRHPTPGQFAEHLGLTFSATPGYSFDLVVIGTGPAGLAAAVYGASEGLDTVSLDAVGAGGQAGSSSRIENYVGFPTGISGADLVAKAAVQAQRLGARLSSPCEVAGLRTDAGFHVVVLADGSEIPCRTVIVASGARYQRLAVEGLDRFEGAGVYYAATDLEARLCSGSEVVVVGGGNSAGQAAIYLAQQGCVVTIAIRGDELAKSMSRYLIERIEADPRITLCTNTEVRALEGADHLEAITLEYTPTGERTVTTCPGLFCFIGADPSTEWLAGTVALDARGFILTDRELPDDVLSSAAFADRAPFPFETSVPGVFAVGDVRHGSLKRVAAAVGEGSSAVRSVHNLLGTLH
jgi:thioredoxin reductase (NADPH)